MNWNELGVAFDIFITGIPCGGVSSVNLYLIQIFNYDRTLAIQSRFSRDTPVQEAIVSLLDELDISNKKTIKRKTNTAKSQ